ncbi:hypothetical protein Tco_1136769, partial [Tanacetum coccineum]
KLHHLPDDVEYDLVNSLLIYIRSLVIKKRVEDVQLGVESYQQKLNLTKPKFTFLRIHKTSPYTMLSNLDGEVYIDKNGGTRFMWFDEVYKFCDGTLKKVIKELQVMLRDNKLGYGHGWLEGRVWTRDDIKGTKRMRNEIERILKARREMRCLEIYVGG